MPYLPRLRPIDMALKELLVGFVVHTELLQPLRRISLKLREFLGCRRCSRRRGPTLLTERQPSQSVSDDQRKPRVLLIPLAQARKAELPSIIDQGMSKWPADTETRSYLRGAASVPFVYLI